MTVRFDLTIKTMDGVRAVDLLSALTELTTLAEGAAANAIYLIGHESELPAIVIQAAMWRAVTDPEGLVWIESIHDGSINIKAILLTVALSTALTSTIGESIKEGWKKTEVHTKIVEIVPKIERYFVESFKNLLEDDSKPVRPDALERLRYAIREDRQDWRIEIDIRPLPERPHR